MNLPLDAAPINARDAGASLLALIEDVARTFTLDSLIESLEASRRLLSRPDSVAVAVLGSFKAGKSSFINSLAGAPILPVAAVPATSILTRVCGGQTMRATITFASGESREAPLGQIGTWITEALNPRNTKSVVSAEIEVPGLRRFPGVEFIDTPGLGSVFTHNSETSLRFLPRMEAAVVAIPSVAPISEADTSLLRRVAQLTPRFVVLLTKADLCSAEQVAEVRRFVESQLRRAGISTAVYLWSQQPDLVGLRAEFIRGFLEPLSGQIGDASREIAAHRLLRLAAEADSLLATAGAAADHDDAVKADLRSRVEALCAGPVGMPALLARLEREAEEGVRPHVLEVLEKEIPRLKADLEALLDEQLATWGGSVAAVERAYTGWLRAALQLHLRSSLKRQQARLAEPLADFAAGCNKLAAEFHVRLADSVTEVLGVSLAPSSWQATFVPPEDPDISVETAFMFRIDWLWVIIPAAIVRPWLRRQLRRRVAWEAEKNLSRIAAQCGEELGRRVREIAQAALNHMLVQQRTIVRLLEQRSISSAEIQSARARLEIRRLAFKHAARADRAPSQT